MRQKIFTVHNKIHKLLFIYFMKDQSSLQKNAVLYMYKIFSKNSQMVILTILVVLVSKGKDSVTGLKITYTLEG